MVEKRILLLFILFTNFSFGFSQEYMEKVSNWQGLPNGWYIGVEQSHNIVIDTIANRSGKYALFIETTDATPERSNATIWYQIPAKYQGKKIFLKASMKTGAKDQMISLMLNLCDIDENGLLKTLDRSWMTNRGTIRWKNYSTKKLSLTDEVKIVVIGVALTGHGKLWADNFEILVDGKKMSIAKLIEHNIIAYHHN